MCINVAVDHDKTTVFDRMLAVTSDISSCAYTALSSDCVSVIELGHYLLSYSTRQWEARREIKKGRSLLCAFDLNDIEAHNISKKEIIIKIMELQRVLLRSTAAVTGVAGVKNINCNKSSSSTITTSCSSDSMVVPREEVIRYVADSLVKVGASEEDAIAVGEHLFTADYRGHFSHGMNRMEMYVQDVINKLTDPKAKPEIITDHKVSEFPLEVFRRQRLYKFRRQ